ncbi:MAG TPA: hypothetical protein PLC93_00655 [Rhodocyclaceae bacterium]|nr:hypothetical protein [Rhodocyclaceae bacterium]
MKRHHLRILACSLLSAPVAAFAQVTITSGVDFTSGKYGEADKTDTLVIPVLLKYETGPWTAKLNLPWIRTKGTVNRETGELGGGTDRPSKTQSGLGDLTASVFYSVLEPSKSGIGLDLGGKIKFATADSKKCLLTTGETDYSVQADLYTVAGDVTPFMTVGWTKKGDPVRRDANCSSLGEKIDFKNPWFAGVGFSYKLSSATSAGLSYDYRRKIVSTGDPVSEATVFVSHRLAPNLKLQGYGIAGFSDNSPDWGLGATIAYSF